MPENTGTSQTVYTGNPTKGQPGSTVFRHVILFKTYDGTTDETIDEALRLMVDMCEDPTVVHYEVGLSQDTRKGKILFELVDYADEDAFNAFKATPAHQAYANFIRNHADWIIADYSVAV
jgi:quinol monooxygenase YgiN